MKIQAYCRNCKEKKNIINSEIKEIISSRRGKMKFCIGNCEVCGRKISVILPKEINSKIKELEEEIISEKEKERLKEQKEIDRQKLDKFFEDSKENPIIQRNKDKIEVVDKEDKRVLSKNYYALGIAFLIILSFLVLILVYRTYYFENFIPNYNSTCDINVTCGDNSCPACPVLSCPIIPGCPECTNNCKLNCGNES